jgi:hypothetical protein
MYTHIENNSKMLGLLKTGFASKISKTAHHHNKKEFLG